VVLHFLAVLSAGAEEGRLGGRVIPEGALIVIEDVESRHTFQVGPNAVDESSHILSTHL